jgi:hypothetical protein
LPALTSKSYDELELQDAKSTALEYFRRIKKYTPENEEGVYFDPILDYCKLDTEGMIDIVEKLKEIAGS